MTPAQAFLDRIEIATPCLAAWADMTGDDRSRLCALCDKHVYDLSRLSAEEAVDLIRRKEGRVCLRLWRRADGRVLTEDCPMGIRWLAAHRRTTLIRGFAVGVLLAGALACHRRPEVACRPPAEGVVVVVGLMAETATLNPDTYTLGAVYRAEDLSHLPLR